MTPNKRTQVLTLLSQGMTRQEVAKTLNLTLSGVKYHITQINKEKNTRYSRENFATELSSVRAENEKLKAEILALRTQLELLTPTLPRSKIF